MNPTPALLLTLTALMVGCTPREEPAPVPGVRLVHPAPDATVPLVFEAQLEVTGEAEGAGLDFYKGEGAPEPLRSVACPGSCKTSFSHSSGTYEVRGWALIDGTRHETPRHRITVDPVPLAILWSRLRAPDVIEVRFNKPLSSPEDVKVVRSIPRSGSPEQDTREELAVRTTLEGDGKVLVITGTFGLPALLSVSLRAWDSHRAWSLAPTLAFQQGYFTDVGQIENAFLSTHALLFDRQGRAILSSHVTNRRRILRREADGSWTDLVGQEDAVACLRSGFDDGVLVMDAEERLLAFCGTESQVLRLEAGRWGALGGALAVRTTDRQLATDARGRPLALLHHYEASGNRLSLQRYEGGVWTTLAQQLNAPENGISGIGFARTPDGVPIAYWNEGRPGVPIRPHSVYVTETATTPVPWAEGLQLSSPVEDGAGGWWMAALDSTTTKGLVLHMKPGAAAPEIIARDAPLPEGAVLFRDHEERLAVFGRRLERVGSVPNDPGDPSSGSSPIYAVMMTLGRLEDGAWKTPAYTDSDILERAVQEYRLVQRVARGPDGHIYALLSRAWVDASRTPLVLRNQLWLVRR